MKRKILLLLLLPVASFANPVFEVTADHAMSCRDGCRELPKGFKFEASNWGEHDPKIAGSSMFTGDAKAEPQLFRFNHADVSPVLDTQGNMTEPACQWPTGGVMQHAVTDAKGRVYIKRVEVTTKCVNGKMTTIQRALN